MDCVEGGTDSKNLTSEAKRSSRIPARKYNGGSSILAVEMFRRRRGAVLSELQAATSGQIIHELFCLLEANRRGTVIEPCYQNRKVDADIVSRYVGIGLLLGVIKYEEKRNS